MLSAFIRDSCFNVAHWIFAYKYWNIAGVMPILLKFEEVPKKLSLRNEIILWTGVVLNILGPLGYATMGFFLNYGIVNQRFASEDEELTVLTPFNYFKYGVGLE